MERPQQIKSPNKDEEKPQQQDSQTTTGESEKKTKKKEHGDGADFAVRKDTLRDKVTETQAKLQSERPSSLLKKLQKTSAGLKSRQGDASDCPHRTPDLIQAVRTQAEKVAQLLQRVQTVKVDTQIAALEAEAEQCENDRVDLEKKVQKQLDAIAYRTTTKISEARSSYQRAYWKQHKIVQHLVDGQHPPGIAKLLAEVAARCIDETDKSNVEHHEKLRLDTKFADFDGTSPALWVPKGTSDMAVAWRALWESWSAGVQPKCDSLQAKLMEDTSLHGTVGEVSALAMDGLKDLGFLNGLNDMMRLDLEGAKPWVIFARKNKRRHGPLHIPSLGPALWLHSMSDLLVHMMPAGKLLELGVPVHTYESFANTPESALVLKECAMTTMVPEGSDMYIPAGHLLHICYYKAPEGKRAKSPDVDFGKWLLTPLPFKKLLEEADTLWKRAMLKLHIDAAKDKKHQMWTNRTEFLKAILGEEG